MALSVAAVVAQLYAPPVAGVPLLAACVVMVILVPVAQLEVAPVPADDIFQLAGKTAVADEPMLLKFSVMMVVAGILICAFANENSRIVISER